MENMQKRSAIAAAGHKFREKNISKRVQKIVISPIKEMSILADLFQDETGADIVSFGQGITYFDTPAYIKTAIGKFLEEISTAKYTLEPGITELRDLVAKDLKKRKGIKNIHPKKEIMITAGCQEAVMCALASTIDEGDEIILFSPGFASHIEQPVLLGAFPKFVPLIEGKGWKLDIKELEKKITKKTKVILFSNPSNPTGAVLSEEEARGLVKIAEKHDLIIITDETYDFLVYDGIKHFSPASVPGAKDRVILCGSFSKKYAMTGYRVGFAYADSGIIDHMLKVHDALTICAPAISQKGVIAALQSDQTSVVEFIKKLDYNRTLMCKKLDGLKGIFEYQKPKGAYYILAKYKIPNINSFDLSLKVLREAHVITIPGAAFGPTGEGHLRFSFACSPQEIEEGFKRLSKWAKQLGK
jgi:aminotransferase